jgi:hypothetical protein
MAGGLLRRRAPDPARAHGAWVYLAVSVLSGVLCTHGRGVLAASCVGLALVGVFLLASGLAIHPKPARSRVALGLALAAGGTLGALALGADRMFLVYAGTAAFPAGAAAWLGQRFGFQSVPALVFAAVTLAVAAPAAACAGGADARLGLLLFALLAPFFAWRTWRTRNTLRAQQGWDRAALKRLGLREAAFAVSWMALAIATVHVVARLR